MSNEVSDPDAVRQWRSRDIAQRIATPRATVARTLIPEMVRAGVLVRRGRFWFGRAVDIDSWLLGRWKDFRVAAEGSRDG